MSELKNMRKDVREVRGFINEIFRTKKAVQKTAEDVITTDEQVKTKDNQAKTRLERSEIQLERARQQREKLEQQRAEREQAKKDSVAPQKDERWPEFVPPEAPELSRKDERRLNKVNETREELDATREKLDALKGDSIDDSLQQKEIKKLEKEEERLEKKEARRDARTGADEAMEEFGQKTEQYKANKEAQDAEKQAFKDNSRAIFDQMVIANGATDVATRDAAVLKALEIAKSMEDAHGRVALDPEFFPDKEQKQGTGRNAKTVTTPASGEFDSAARAVEAMSAEVARRNGGAAIGLDVLQGVEKGTMPVNAPTEKKTGDITKPEVGVGSTQTAVGDIDLPAASGHMAAGTLSTKGKMPKIDAAHVASVQEMLAKNDPVLADALATQKGGRGSWGPKTQAAFEKVCKASGVDPKSVDFTTEKGQQDALAMIAKSTKETTQVANQEPAKKEEKAPDTSIKAMQEKLIAAGYDLTATGVWDDKSKAAMNSFVEINHVSGATKHEIVSSNKGIEDGRAVEVANINFNDPKDPALLAAMEALKKDDIQGPTYAAELNKLLQPAGMTVEQKMAEDFKATGVEMTVTTNSANIAAQIDAAAKSDTRVIDVASVEGKNFLAEASKSLGFKSNGAVLQDTRALEEKLKEQGVAVEVNGTLTQGELKAIDAKGAVLDDNARKALDSLLKAEGIEKAQYAVNNAKAGEISAPTNGTVGAGKELLAAR